MNSQIWVPRISILRCGIRTSTSFSYFTGGGETNTNAIVSRSNTANDAKSSEVSATYYLSDHLGSARMTLATGGWPVTMDTYYPYGVEPTPPAAPDHYKTAGRRDQPSLCFGMLIFLISFLLSSLSMPLFAQTVEIKLVDGRNGRPMVGASSYVNVWVGTERKEAIAIPMDENGVARLQLTLNPSEVNIPNSENNGSIVVDHPIVKYAESFRINAPYVLCAAGGSNYSWLGLKTFTTREILDHGYASANTCGRVTVLPQPGQVVLFVRPLTFWEKLKQ